MIDIIQELDDLKSYIAGLARTDMILTSMPPQHNFSTTVTVENVIEKIEQIERKILNNNINNNNNNNDNVSSTIKSLMAYIQSYVDSKGPCTEKFITGLYSIIGLIEDQIKILESNFLELQKDNEILANRDKILIRIHDIINRD